VDVGARRNRSEGVCTQLQPLKPPRWSARRADRPLRQRWVGQLFGTKDKESWCRGFESLLRYAFPLFAALAYDFPRFFMSSCHHNRNTIQVPTILGLLTFCVSSLRRTLSTETGIPRDRKKHSERSPFGQTL
jgi:hypothetical protein